jgi:toxin ParE1/3/4
MDEYQVIITPDAESDLNELDDYITYELFAPDTAIAYLQDIKEQLASLGRNPKRYKLVNDKPWHSRGVRRMNTRNFAAFYTILEEDKTVYIQNVIYQKRDIPRILRKTYFIDFEN